MTKQKTTIKMSDSEALEYLDFIQDEIRVKYPKLRIEIYVTVPWGPYNLYLGVGGFMESTNKTLHISHGESFQNRIYHLKQWWDKNQDKLKPYLRK